MARTNPDGRTDALTHGRTHIHRTKIVTTMSRLLDKNDLDIYFSNSLIAHYYA